MAIEPERIKAIRLRAGLTQEQLAKRLAVTRDAVASWEIGRNRMKGPAEILIRQLEAELEASEVPSP